MRFRIPAEWGADRILQVVLRGERDVYVTLRDQLL